MPQVTIPPLRERREEIPLLIAQTVQSTAPALSVDVSLVEVCLLHFWPGNVRELQAEITTAALTARAAGKTLSTAAQLRKYAGMMLQLAPRTGHLPAPPPEPEPAAAEPPSRSQLLAALLTADFNIAATARALHLHRTQLRRLLVRYGIDLTKLRAVDKAR